MIRPEEGKISSGMALVVIAERRAAQPGRDHESTELKGAMGMTAKG
jgi:hypothetical protein